MELSRGKEMDKGEENMDISVISYQVTEILKIQNIEK